MIARWSVEWKARTNEGDLLQVVEVYAPGENKEVVKAESGSIRIGGSYCSLRERGSRYKLCKKYYATDGIRTRTRFLSIG